MFENKERSEKQVILLSFIIPGNVFPGLALSFFFFSQQNKKIIKWNQNLKNNLIIYENKKVVENESNVYNYQGQNARSGYQSHFALSNFPFELFLFSFFFLLFNS